MVLVDAFSSPFLSICVRYLSDHGERSVWGRGYGVSPELTDVPLILYDSNRDKSGSHNEYRVENVKISDEMVETVEDLGYV